jgi:cell division protein ZapA
VNSIEVTIMGQGYRLVCPEGGEAPLLAAAAVVDREMSAIRDAGKVKARERIAVLAALNLAFSQAERPAAATSSSGEAVAAVDVDALIKRIDQTLGADGQLL